MAMLQMQRIFIYALKKDRKPILELLQRHDNVEINDVIAEDNVFHKMDMSHAKSSLEKNIASAKEALEILDRYSTEKKPFLSMLNGRKTISIEDYDAFKEKHDSILRTANHIVAYAKEIAENKAELIKLQTQAEMLVPWTNLDIPLEFAGTKYTKSFIGTIPNEWTLEKIYEKLAAYLPLNIDIISTSKEQTCIFVLCTKDAADNVYETLRNIEFSHPSISSDKAPADQLAAIDQLKQELSIANDKAAENIIALASYLEEIQFLQDYEKMRADKYKVIGELSQSQNIFVLSGYIPKCDTKALEDTLNEKFELEIELEDPTDEEDVPVLLNNNGFSQPLEGIVNGFALPGKGEIDPTMIMSLFYYVLFGLMLSDAGYGALMVIACGYGLIKFKNKMEKATVNILKMYLFCGIST
ncbi:MAG: V-type ATPase 116kDa subunit family protein, partial [Mobilitalea sp.]